MSGEVVISQGGVVGSINSNLKGAGTYIILGGADRFPYQLVVPPSIQQISDLKGKTFAVSRIGSADHTATMFVLPKLGIQPDKELISFKLDRSQAVLPLWSTARSWAHCSYRQKR